MRLIAAGRGVDETHVPEPPVWERMQGEYGDGS